MSILDTIIEHKKQKLAFLKEVVSERSLRESEYFNRQTLSLINSLLKVSSTGIIAEYKKGSPSKGIINDAANVEEVAFGYSKYRAAGISILTDEEFFLGSNEDMLKARMVVRDTPILRKEFIIDEFQVLESKSIGADVILLIAACLTPAEVQRLAALAKQLQMEVLLEIHHEEEIGHICDETELIGVNNRDLKSFAVDVNRSIQLADKIPSDKIKISESGISDTKTIDLLKQHGYKGFLMGETFMKEKNPVVAFSEFIGKLNYPIFKTRRAGI